MYMIQQFWRYTAGGCVVSAGEKGLGVRREQGNEMLGVKHG